jgi:hypothetical protein
MAAKMAMMAMTTRSSMRVNAAGVRCFEIGLMAFVEYTPAGANWMQRVSLLRREAV